MKINVEIGNLITTIDVFVVELKVPFLIGEDVITEKSISIINEDGESHAKIGIKNESFKKEKKVIGPCQ